MKKALSVFLSVLMLLSVIAVSASASNIYTDIFGDVRPHDYKLCACDDHITEKGACHCCIYCVNLDTTYINKCCSKTTLSNGEEVWVFCCPTCNGLWDCGCVDCECCSDKNDETLDEGSNAIIPPSVQNSFIEAFQNALKKVSDVFDKLFDAIFEFLRIEDFFGD